MIGKWAVIYIAVIEPQRLYIDRLNRKPITGIAVSTLYDDWTTVWRCDSSSVVRVCFCLGTGVRSVKPDGKIFFISPFVSIMYWYVLKN